MKSVAWRQTIIRFVRGNLLIRPFFSSSNIALWRHDLLARFFARASMSLFFARHGITGRGRI